MSRRAKKWTPFQRLWDRAFPRLLPGRRHPLALNRTVADVIRECRADNHHPAQPSERTPK